MQRNSRAGDVPVIIAPTELDLCRCSPVPSPIGSILIVSILLLLCSVVSLSGNTSRYVDDDDDDWRRGWCCTSSRNSGFDQMPIDDAPPPVSADDCSHCSSGPECRGVLPVVVHMRGPAGNSFSELESSSIAGIKVKDD